jgi:hypothetical protein
MKPAFCTGKKLSLFCQVFSKAQGAKRELGLVDGMTVDDHEDRLGGADHQTRQELLERAGRDASFMDHETEIPTGNGFMPHEYSLCPQLI